MSKRKLVTAALAALTFAAPAIAQEPISEAGLVETVRTMTDDWFQGRAPGTIGEERTIGYLIGRFQALGLEPGGPDGQWIQKVPLLHTRLGAPQQLELATPQGTVPLKLGTDIYLSTLRNESVAKVAAAPLVFLGYGVTAPERKWDDFKGQDLKGKVAVFLINDPDFEAAKGEPVAGKFGGKTMTYYGRWTYKFEEAARRGAIAALIVHDAEGVGYGWNVITSPGGENYGLVSKDGSQTSLALQGWVSHEQGDRLFASAGLDLKKLRLAARSAKFKPVDLKELQVTIEAVWRRLQKATAGDTTRDIRVSAEDGATPGWVLDPVARTLQKPTQGTLALSGTECALLSLLTSHAGELVTKEHIIDAVYPGETGCEFHRIEVVLARLRQKARGQQIVLPVRSVFGKGLVFADECHLANTVRGRYSA